MFWGQTDATDMARDILDPMALSCESGARFIFGLCTHIRLLPNPPKEAYDPESRTIECKISIFMLGEMSAVPTRMGTPVQDSPLLQLLIHARREVLIWLFSRLGLGYCWVDVAQPEASKHARVCAGEASRGRG